MQDNKATQGLLKVTCAQSKQLNMTKTTLTRRDCAYYRGSLEEITAEFLDCTRVGRPGAEAEERQRGAAAVAAAADGQASMID